MGADRSRIDIALRMAKSEDVEQVADLLDIANNSGMAVFWRSEIGSGETWRDIVRRRFMSPSSRLSMKNTMVAEVDGEVAGMLMFAILPETPIAIDSVDPVLRPYIELQNQAPGSFYINNAAVFPKWRRRGISSALRDVVIRVAYDTGLTDISTTVHESKDFLLAHYAKRGMTVVASAAIGPDSVYPADSRVLLLTCKKPAGFLTPANKE